jgi:uncharacterized membrane protein
VFFFFQQDLTGVGLIFLKTCKSVQGYLNMNDKISKSLLQTLVLGIIAGMRAASAPAAASHMLSVSKPEQLLHSPLAFMRSDKWAAALKVIAAGEMVVDKLPAAPNRIEAGGLIARGLSGGLSGAALSKANGEKAYIGLFAGTAAALASAYAFYYLRKYVVNKTGIYDPLIGGIEDLLVIGSAVALIRSAK